MTHMLAPGEGVILDDGRLLRRRTDGSYKLHGDERPGNVVPVPKALAKRCLPLKRAAVSLSVPQAQRDKAKSAGLTFPGSDSYPLAGPDGTFSRALASKAVRMVGLGNVGSKAAIQRWLTAKLKANGAADLIPKEWT